ncbi:MAG: hypothetical protein WC964_02300 [Acholeplasmataceae bacterium]
MFKAMFLSELKKLQYSKMLRVVIIVFISTLVLYFGTILAFDYLASTIPPGMDSGNPLVEDYQVLSPTIIMSFYAAGSTGIFTVLYSAIVSAYVGKEYQTTLRQTLISVSDRKQYYYVKMMVLSIIFIVYTIVTLLSFYLIYGFIIGFSNIVFADTSKVVLAAISLFFVMWGLVALFMMLVILLKNKVNIILIVLGSGFVIEIVTMIFSYLKNQIFFDILVYFPTNQLSYILLSNPETKHIIGGFISGIVMLVGSTIIGSNLLNKQDI